MRRRGEARRSRAQRSCARQGQQAVNYCSNNSQKTKHFFWNRQVWFWITLILPSSKLTVTEKNTFHIWVIAILGFSKHGQFLNGVIIYLFLSLQYNEIITFGSENIKCVENFLINNLNTVPEKGHGDTYVSSQITKSIDSLFFRNY